MIYQTPATCNHHGLRQGTDLTLSLLVTHISSRPSRSSCTKTKPYQTSATGHINFLEFANCPSLCLQSMQYARRSDIIPLLKLQASSTRAGPCTDPEDYPPSRLPTLPIHPTSSTSPRAGKTSLRSEPLNRAVPADHLRAQPWRGISIAWRAARAARNSVNYEQSTRT